MSLDQRLLGMTAHPEYNQAFMQELVISDYFKNDYITPDMNYESYKNCQRWFDDEKRDDRDSAWRMIQKWLMQESFGS